MRIQYELWKPQAKSRMIVETANAIIDEYSDQDYSLTLRQMYYQFVARDLIPNTEASYKSFGDKINRARLAGMIDWDAIVDRTRNLNAYLVEENPMVPLQELPYAIQYDHWGRQEFHVECWVEKEALIDVVAKACDKYKVPYLSCRGYMSQSEQWRAGQRFLKAHEQGKRSVIIHLGDHDPSGLDMTRDNQDRVDLLSDFSNVSVDRIALNMDQIEQYAPPPNYAKVTDSRWKHYIKRYGVKSWELDALEPKILSDLITTRIETHIDFAKWTLVDEQEKEAKRHMARVYERWDQIEPIVRDTQ